MSERVDSSVMDESAYLAMQIFPCLGGSCRNERFQDVSDLKAACLRNMDCSNGTAILEARAKQEVLEEWNRITLQFGVSGGYAAVLSQDAPSKKLKDVWRAATESEILNAPSLVSRKSVRIALALVSLCLAGWMIAVLPIGPMNTLFAFVIATSLGLLVGNWRALRAQIPKSHRTLDAFIDGRIMALAMNNMGPWIKEDVLRVVDAIVNNRRRAM